MHLFCANVSADSTPDITRRMFVVGGGCALVAVPNEANASPAYLLRPFFGFIYRLKALFTPRRIGLAANFFRETILLGGAGATIASSIYDWIGPRHPPNLLRFQQD